MANNTKTHSRSDRKVSRNRAPVSTSSIDPPDNTIPELFQAFSDRTRLRVLHLLLRGETCVGDLVSVLRLPQPRVSQQLSRLRNAGLVVGRKEGQWTHYSLAKPVSAVHEQLLKCLELCSEEIPELQVDESRADALDQDGHCCS
ncbi:ArsR/SmtB family transcription factor [Thalassoroseus pseudoceratinae]|uniref:ArsR/SmtB family transcription factor n=1 Tax=Thalassoroseus pseudoceratinae TaxID=2713176 RepID=UPI00142174B3|nr:metalloregulator ArsR/SmtB family transcription factor [Thalassoroseus pseudoceratinae]